MKLILEPRLLPYGASVSFYIKLGSGSSSSGCENVDPGKGVVLEMSTDMKIWHQIWTRLVDAC